MQYLCGVTTREYFDDLNNDHKTVMQFHRLVVAAHALQQSALQQTLLC